MIARWRVMALDIDRGEMTPITGWLSFADAMLIMTNVRRAVLQRSQP